VFVPVTSDKFILDVCLQYVHDYTQLLELRRRNTSAQEQNWKRLNPLRRSLRFAAPAVFDTLLLHAVNYQNIQTEQRHRSHRLD
jgi:hypothetical protein